MNHNDTWIESFQGLKINFLAPTPEMFDIRDIAHGLANKCRFAGQCIRYVSVAEHCVLLCENFGWGNEEAFALLMHDASEAYTGDMPSPMKRHLPDFVTMEDELQSVIDTKFNVKYSDIIKSWDTRFCIDERAQNMRRTVNEWNFGDLTPLGIALKYWSPQQAEERFLSNFHRLNRLLNKVPE